MRRLLITLMMLVLLAVWSLDYVRFNLDSASCSSDSLYVAKRVLEEFESTYGRLPQDWSEYEEFNSRNERPAHLHCDRSGGAFEWMPDYAKPREGETIVLACPSGSHGFIRRFAWAVAYDGSEFQLVRLRPDGTVLDGH